MEKIEFYGDEEIKSITMLLILQQCNKITMMHLCVQGPELLNEKVVTESFPTVQAHMTCFADFLLIPGLG